MWHLIMVSTGISQMADDVQYLFMHLLAFAYLLQRNVYANPLPIGMANFVCQLGWAMVYKSVVKSFLDVFVKMLFG